MSILYILIPLAVLLAGAFVIAFLWAVRRGQFDDLATPAVRMLGDDEPIDLKKDNPASKPEAPGATTPQQAPGADNHQ